MPRVSVVTPSYNTSTFLPRTIESVQAQTMENWEHIIVDDGSTDGTFEVIQPYLQSDNRLRFITQENKGSSSARNHGARLSSPKSDYMFFLDADDVLRPDMLQQMVHYLDDHPEAALAYCRFQMIDEFDSLLPLPDWHDKYGTRRFVPTLVSARELPPNVAPTPFISLYAGFHFLIPSISVIRRSVYEQAPPWDESLSPHEDLDFFWRISLLGEIHFLNAELVLYRQHANQSSDKTSEATKRTLYRKWERLSEAPSPLSPEQKSLIRTAQIFKEGKLLPYLLTRESAINFKNREWSTALRCLGGALKNAFRAALRYRSQFFQTEP